MSKAKEIKLNMEEIAKNAKMGKKISVAVVCGDIKKHIKNKSLEEGAEFPVMRVVGMANNYMTGESDNGPWTALKGQFIGINLLDPEKPTANRAGKCFIPCDGEQGIVNMLMENEGGTAQVGIDVFAKVDFDMANDYEYYLMPVIEPTVETDPLLALISGIDKPLALPGA